MYQQKQFRTTGQGPRTTIQNKKEDPKNSSKSPPSSLGAQNFSKLKNFRDLKVWQTAKEIAVTIYNITKRFPQDELYGLSSQMRRSAISISSNIAEGFNRFYKKDYQRFLMIALGSCGELESQIEVGTALGYILPGSDQGLLEKLNHENRMLRKLHSKMNEKPV